MSSAPASLHDPASHATQRAEDAQRHRQMLHELADMGMDIARALHRHATAEPAAPEAQPAAPAPERAPGRAITASAAFDCIARTVRRTIALAHKLSEPDRERAPKEHTAQGGQHGAQRARQRRAEGTEAEALHADLCERPEAPDYDPDDGELDEQSLAELIAAAYRNTRLAKLTDAQLCKPRPPQGAPKDMPDDVPEHGPDDGCGVRARAAQIPRPGTTGQPRAQPVPGDPRLIPADPAAPACTGPPRP